MEASILYYRLQVSFVTVTGYATKLQFNMSRYIKNQARYYYNDISVHQDKYQNIDVLPSSACQPEVKASSLLP